MQDDATRLTQLRYDLTKHIEAATLDNSVMDLLRYRDGFLPLESELWDYKRQEHSVEKTVLQCVSFYNTFGGYILFGVDQTTAPYLPIGIPAKSLNQQQLRAKLRSYTGEIIDVSYMEFPQSDGNLLGLLHIPKRPRSKEPVFFGKNGPQEGKDHVFRRDQAYLRLQDNCVPASTKEHFMLLFSPRLNPFLLPQRPEMLGSAALLSIPDHNLPDRNFICPVFVGRDRIIEELWRWLGDELVRAKLLAGDGGKGKTSIAYEFAEEVCRSRPYQIEKVIWLTAKSRQFMASQNEFVQVPETHYNDLPTLLHALALQLALTEEEIAGASTALLKRLIRSALTTLPCLVIVDDVDSVATDQQRAILETAMQIATTSGARFLLTTRMNLTYSRDASITVGGFERSEYRAYIYSLLTRMRLPELTTRVIDKLRTATDGSPLFTESLLRLYASGINIQVAIAKWKGKLGSEVRKAALLREIDSLSTEARRVLLACAYMGEASVTELRQVTGYDDERMLLCLDELQTLFLLSAPEFIKKEPRFRVSSNTALLVIENGELLVHNPSSVQRTVQRLRSRSLNKQASAVRERIVAAINQAVALQRAQDSAGALETIDAALAQFRDNGELLFTRGRLLFERATQKDRRMLRPARQAFRKAYSVGLRRDALYDMWYAAEVAAADAGGAVEVATLAIEDHRVPESGWLSKRAAAYKMQAQAHERSLNSDGSVEDLEFAADDLVSAIQTAPDSQRAPLAEFLAQCNDEAWRIVWGSASDLPEQMRAFQLTLKGIARGDKRPLMLSRLLAAAETVVNHFEAYDQLNQAQFNLVEQVLRQTGGALSEMGPIRDSATWTTLQTRLRRLRGIGQRLLKAAADSL